MYAESINMIEVAQYGILGFLSLLLVFHCCVLLKLIPYQLIWGGRLKSDQEMIRFEVVSIVLTIAMLCFMLIQSGFLHLVLSNTFKTTVLLIMAVLFFLSTLGNFSSNNNLEKRIFAPISILLTIFCLILAFFK